eukprot:15145353-Ditylum_brightwellii.AAC.2
MPQSITVRKKATMKMPLWQKTSILATRRHTRHKTNTTRNIARATATESIKEATQIAIREMKRITILKLKTLTIKTPMPQAKKKKKTSKT